ncbi:Serine-threonine/tyrosine-protein kinase [Theobroma cacao]|nr:Serine-threonine/tyrosine-protein kinase [Theobroma cacao]
MTLLSRIRTILKSKEEKAFIRNGSILLQELVAFCNGKCNPICGFSAKELKRATNNYDLRRVLHKNRFYKFYKGLLRDQPVLIKKFKGNFERCEVVFNEIVVASLMSVHKNVLKLLGCCLETKVPTLVFEFAESRNLGDQVSRQNNNCHFQPLSWRCRLKIAMDIANVVAYLHTAFPKPIIHRDIRCLNIFLSEDCTAKLSDFSVSRSFSDDEVDVKDEVPEIMGLTTAEYMAKQDVYSVEELIAFCNGKSNPIRNFSAEELKIATNNYGEGRCFLRSHDNFNSIADYSETVLQMLTETYPERTWGADYYNLYEGYLQDRPVSVKKYISIDVLSKIFKDIAIGSQMSAHKNVLKLLGCCLETKYPIIVYEFVGTRILSDFLCDANGAQCQPLPWRCRLKIAVDLASAVEYLHTAFSKPVILHRDIRSSNVILDQDNVPKLIDFALSISIPECQLHVEEFESNGSHFINGEWTDIITRARWPLPFIMAEVIPSAASPQRSSGEQQTTMMNNNVFSMRGPAGLSEDA